VKRSSITKPASLSVFYDGSCPLCAAEIGIYQDADPGDALHCIDVSSPSFVGDTHITRQDAMQRFHVRTADGRQMSGARAFVALWLALPSWRWIGRISNNAVVLFLLERFYRLFLHGRPLVVTLFRKLARDRPQT
jgi:predicted DCC family thiol-disulfide oxidoreductase YuxK